MTKTILKWAGNKSKVMDKIGKLFPNEYERYLEPFAGSLGAFLNSGVECKALICLSVYLRTMKECPSSQIQ